MMTKLGMGDVKNDMGKSGMEVFLLWWFCKKGRRGRGSVKKGR